MSSTLIPLDETSQLLEKILAQLDITLSSLRDSILGTGNKTLTHLYSELNSIRAQTDRLTFDASNYLYVRIGASDIGLGGGVAQLQVKNSSGIWTDVGYATGNLNVPVQIRADDVGLATESTLATLSSKFPSATSLGDSLSNPTTTIVGSALLGWDGSKWRRVAVDTTSRLRTVVETLPALPSGTNIIGGVFADYSSNVTINQQVGTTEVTGSVVDVRRRGRKVIFMKNTQDVAVTVTIEGSYDGTDWYVIRSGITLNSNDHKVGVLTDPYGYIRARAVASASPTTGSVVITVSSMT